MKLLAALVALMAVGAVVGLVVAIRGTRDPVPARVQACVRKSDAELARGPINLQAARPEVETHDVRVVRRYRLGQDDAVLMAGVRFRLLVLGGRKSPPLSGDLALEAYRNTGAFPVVAIEIDPVRGQLDGCARSSG